MKTGICLILTSALILQGCCTMITGEKEEILIESNPSGQYVRVDGFKHKTPVKLNLKRKSDHFVVFPNGRRITISQDIWGNQVLWLNAVWFVAGGLIGGLIAMLVDVATGASKNLEPDHLLYKDGKVIDYENGEVLTE